MVPTRTVYYTVYTVHNVTIMNMVSLPYMPSDSAARALMCRFSSVYYALLASQPSLWFYSKVLRLRGACLWSVERDGPVIVLRTSSCVVAGRVPASDAVGDALLEAVLG